MGCIDTRRSGYRIWLFQQGDARDVSDRVISYENAGWNVARGQGGYGQVRGRIVRGRRDGDPRSQSLERDRYPHRGAMDRSGWTGVVCLQRLEELLQRRTRMRATNHL